MRSTSTSVQKDWLYHHRVYASVSSHLEDLEDRVSETNLILALGILRGCMKSIECD